MYVLFNTPSNPAGTLLAKLGSFSSYNSTIIYLLLNGYSPLEVPIFLPINPVAFTSKVMFENFSTTLGLASVSLKLLTNKSNVLLSGLILTIENLKSSFAALPSDIVMNLNSLCNVAPVPVPINSESTQGEAADFHCS